MFFDNMIDTRSSTLNGDNNDEFHDSQEEIDLTKENFSLGMVYSQLKLYGSELLTDILTQLQNENQCLRGGDYRT